ncbi:hypothetical protein IGI04_041640 [Brassica rapa subsp. trilocularis]|uniref:Uncharacterized protein n=1 Tax=Brassica rapa subsp. trilocularis TaxID=1813537 RepID=A0ABQ7KS20_BRACM|nr:hypothetical protein IGI04_041640 [Brassica rapa subsp. trilocularis]
MIDVRRRTVKRRRNEPSIGQTKTTSFKLVHTPLFIYPQNLPSLPVVRELLCVSSRSVRFRTSIYRSPYRFCCPYAVLLSDL